MGLSKLAQKESASEAHQVLKPEQMSKNSNVLKQNRTVDLLSV